VTLVQAEAAERHANARYRTALAAGDELESLRARVRRGVALVQVAQLGGAVMMARAQEELRSARHDLRKFCLERA